MHFGAGKTKLEVVADFIEALGQSVFRAGDALGMTRPTTGSSESGCSLINGSLQVVGRMTSSFRVTAT